MSLRETGRVALPAAEVCAGLSERARAAELPLRDVDGGIEVDLWGALLRAVPGRAGTRLELRAPDASLLHSIREMVTHQLEGAGALPEWDGVIEGTLPGNVSLAEVVDVRDVSPSYRRVRLSGADLGRFALGGLHFRLLIPPDGVVPAWPTMDESGRTVWPKGDRALHQPVYTVRHIAPRERWLEFDIFLHSGSRSTRWSEAVVAGAEIGLAGPGGGGVPEVPHLGLWGDETAVPAILRILAEAPASSRGEACLRVDAADLPELPRRPGWEVRRVDDRAALVEDMRRSALPDDGGFVWFGGEASDAATCREIARDRGVARTKSLIATYWTA